MGTRGPECSICARTDVGDIHRAIEAGGSQRSVAEAFGLKEATLRLHLAHVTLQRPEKGTRKAPASRPAPVPAPAPEEKPVAPRGEQTSEAPALPMEPDLAIEDIDGRIRQLARTGDRLRVAAENGTLRERGAALSEARKTLESMVKLVAMRDEGREVAVLKSPEWGSLRAELLEALRPFPDARAALVERLRVIEGGG